MYRFYYNHVVPHWGRDRVQLMAMTDTDSLMLKVKKKAKDIWADIKTFNK